MTDKKKLPIGIEFLSDMIGHDFYYVDKTMLIADLLRNWAKVCLFTRPRRFGKSLNMDMLKSFFEIGCDRSLFDGLKISEEKELCEKYMGQYPVISVSLRGVEGPDFESAKEAFRSVIGNEAMRFQFLADSENLSEDEKRAYRSMIRIDRGNITVEEMTLETSLKTLSVLLSRHYGKNVCR